jgi:hypothetical protein
MIRQMAVAGVLIMLVAAVLVSPGGASETLEFSIVYSNNINGNVVPCRA